MRKLTFTLKWLTIEDLGELLALMKRKMTEKMGWTVLKMESLEYQHFYNHLRT